MSQTLTKGSLKLVSSNKNQILGFYPTIILLPVEVDIVSQKKDWKRNLVRFFGSGYCK